MKKLLYLIFIVGFISCEDPSFDCGNTTELFVGKPSLFYTGGNPPYIGIIDTFTFEFPNRCECLDALEFQYNKHQDDLDLILENSGEEIYSYVVKNPIELKCIEK